MKRCVILLKKCVILLKSLHILCIKRQTLYSIQMYKINLKKKIPNTRLYVNYFAEVQNIIAFLLMLTIDIQIYYKKICNWGRDIQNSVKKKNDGRAEKCGFYEKEWRTKMFAEKRRTTTTKLLIPNRKKNNRYHI